MCLMVESACDVTPDWLRRDFVMPQSFRRRRSQVVLMVNQTNVGCERIKNKFAFKMQFHCFFHYTEYLNR